MRTIITLFSCMFFMITNSATAQSDWAEKAEVEYANAKNVEAKLTQDEKQFIDAVFGDKVTELVYNNPDFLKSLKHLIRNRISIVKVESNSKAKKGMLLSKIPLANDFATQEISKFSTIEGFNPLKYKMEFFSKGTYMYIIDNTDYVIEITSQFRK